MCLRMGEFSYDWLCVCVFAPDTCICPHVCLLQCLWLKGHSLRNHTSDAVSPLKLWKHKHEGKIHSVVRLLGMVAPSNAVQRGVDSTVWSLWKICTFIMLHVHFSAIQFNCSTNCILQNDHMAESTPPKQDKKPNITTFTMEDLLQDEFVLA